jgi:hypothetical protein
VFVGGVVVEDGMDDLAGGNGALDGPRKAMNSACVCLSGKPPDSLIAYLAGSESLLPLRGALTMHAKKRTVANTPYEEALNEMRAAVPAWRAIADRAYAVAARMDEEGPRRGIERVGFRPADLIIAISELSH